MNALNRAGLQQFYRRWQLHRIREVLTPLKHHPIIFCANHENALIDPLNLVAALQNVRQPYFMTRSDVFGLGFDFLLNRIKMRPIYRQRDKVDVAAANEAIFQEMIVALGDGDSMIIFPEGNHGRERRLRPLKKGFARIGFQAEESNDYTLDLMLVPVGIVYWEHLFPGADVLVQLGEPIAFSDYYELHQAKPAQAILQIRKELFERMAALIHHIRVEGEAYELINLAWQYAGKPLAMAEGHASRDLVARFAREKAIIEVLEPEAEAGSEAWSAFAEALKAFENERSVHGIAAAEVAGGGPRPGWLFLASLGLLLGLPFFLLGTAVNGPLYYFFDRLARNKFNDDHFHSSIRFAGSWLGYPVVWLLLWVIGWAVLGSFGQSLLWLAAIIGSGWLSLRYWRLARTFGRRWRWFRLWRDNKAAVEELRSRWNTWYTALQGWLQTEKKPVV